MTRRIAAVAARALLGLLFLAGLAVAAVSLLALWSSDRPGASSLIILTAAYVRVLGGLTQGDTVAVAGSTLLAAALFQPLRHRIQHAVDHRFNRARCDAERTATDFADRLRGEVDLASLSEDITGVVDMALSPSTVEVWIRPSNATTP